MAHYRVEAGTGEALPPTDNETEEMRKEHPPTQPSPQPPPLQHQHKADQAGADELPVCRRWPTGSQRVNAMSRDSLQWNEPTKERPGALTPPFRAQQELQNTARPSTLKTPPPPRETTYRLSMGYREKLSDKMYGRNKTHIIKTFNGNWDGCALDLNTTLRPPPSDRVGNIKLGSDPDSLTDSSLGQS
ncbi:unnamed protein product [Lota lota]